MTLACRGGSQSLADASSPALSFSRLWRTKSRPPRPSGDPDAGNAVFARAVRGMRPTGRVSIRSPILENRSRPATAESLGPLLPSQRSLPSPTRQGSRVRIIRSWPQGFLLRNPRGKTNPLESTVIEEYAGISTQMRMAAFPGVTPRRK